MTDPVAAPAEAPAASITEGMTLLNPDTITEYDFVIGLDASGSMASPSTRFAGKTRWEEAQETIFGLASALAKYDDDGIDVVVFGATVEVFEGVTPDKVSEIFNSRSPRGSTPLASAINEISRLNSDGKKAVAIIFTDGEPDSELDVISAISGIANNQANDDDFTLLFVQIGSDAGAAKFLAKLDDGLNTKFDIVDTVSAAQADMMEPIDLINKAIND